MRPRLLPRSRENPSQTEKATGRNSPGENGAPEVGAKGPLEDDRPFSLVVARDAGEIARVVGRDVRASLAGELKGIGAGQIEEPEIHRVLGVAEDEVGLAGARRHLRRNLDRDGVGELGWLAGWRRFRLGKGVLRRPAGAGATSASPKTVPRAALAAAAAGAGSSSSSGGTGSDGPFFPVFSALMSCHRTRRAIESAS